MSLKQRKIQDCERYLNEWDEKKTTLKALENNALSLLPNTVEKIIVNKNKDINKIKSEHSVLMDNAEKTKIFLLNKENSEREVSNFIGHDDFFAPINIVAFFGALFIASITTGWDHVGWGILSIIITVICTFILVLIMLSYFKNMQKKLWKEIEAGKGKLEREEDKLNNYQLNSKIELINLQSLNEMIEHTSVLISEPMLSLFKELQKEYDVIVSKYYLKEFGIEKIDRDMYESIKENFPNTLGLSDDFREKIKYFLSKISNQDLEIKTIKQAVLFEKDIKSSNIS